MTAIEKTKKLFQSGEKRHGREHLENDSEPFASENFSSRQLLLDFSQKSDDAASASDDDNVQLEGDLYALQDDCTRTSETTSKDVQPAPKEEGGASGDGGTREPTENQPRGLEAPPCDDKAGGREPDRERGPGVRSEGPGGYLGSWVPS